jgi:hypothetical protein
MKRIAIITAVIGFFCFITANGMAQTTTTTLPKVEKKVVSRTQVTPAVGQSKTQKDTVTTKAPENTNVTTTTNTQTTTKCQSGTTGTSNTTCTKKCPSTGTSCTHQCTKSTETKTVVPKK